MPVRSRCGSTGPPRSGSVRTQCPPPSTSTSRTSSRICCHGDLMGPSPLVEFFKRGEAARDVRLLAAQGGLSVGAHEQLSILVELLDDPDREIHHTAEQTLNRIPSNSLSAFLARSDVSLGLREFFADRGIFAAAVAAEDDT